MAFLELAQLWVHWLSPIWRDTWKLFMVVRGKNGLAMSAEKLPNLNRDWQSTKEFIWQKLMTERKTYSTAQTVNTELCAKTTWLTTGDWCTPQHRMGNLSVLLENVSKNHWHFQTKQDWRNTNPAMKTRNAVHVENYLVRQEIWSGTREINMTKIKPRAQIQIIVMATTMGIPHFNDQSIWQIYYFLKYTIIPKSKSWFPFKVSELLVNVWSLYQVLRPLEKSDSAKLSSWDLWDLNESSGDRTNEFLRWDLWGPETFREIWFSEIELLRPLGFKRELLRQDKWVPEIFSVIEIPHKISRNQDLRCSKSAPLLRGPGARCTGLHWAPLGST